MTTDVGTPTSMSVRQPDTNLAATYNIPAEQSVLGAMLLSVNAIDDVVDILAAGDFYRPIHGTVYQALLNAYNANQPTDLVAISERLLASGDLERIGGAVYLHTLSTSPPTVANGSYYARMVAECAGRRRLTAAGTRILQTANDAGVTLVDAQDRAGQGILDAIAGRGDESVVRMGDVFGDAITQMEALADQTGLRGISTGIADLDRLTGGFQPGQLIVVAGRPGMGKSVSALDFCRITSILNGGASLYFSLEMSRLDLINRILSAETGIAYWKIRDGQLDTDDWARLARKMGEIQNLPLFVDDTSNLWLSQIRSKARRIKQQHGLKLVVVDYLQLMSSPKKIESRQQEVAELSRGLKLLAKEIECPVIAVSQLNRGPEQRTDKRPTLADLRESGSIEQDADLVILLHRDDYYDKESARAGEADFIIAKHRNGPTDTITVAAQLHNMRFADFNLI